MEKTSFNSLVGIGSKIHVDGLEERIIEFNCSRFMAEKHSNWLSSVILELTFPGAVDNTILVKGKKSLILFLRVTILSLKKHIKSLLLSAMGIEGSVELWLSVSLATVLKINLALFLFSSINEE